MKRYRSFIEDNARWDALALREGDVIISTPAKSGTTWMQQLCSLLIFQAPTPPKPMAEVSPWLDMLTWPLDEVIALLDAQEHRRFIKTHTPLDGLPEDDRVTYVCVGRDPRDVMISWENHFANMDFGAVLAAREKAVGLDDLDPTDLPAPPAPEFVDRFRAWMDEEEDPERGLPGLLRHLQTYWDRRDRDNVELFHYADLSADLDGQLRRLAAALDIDLPEARWAELLRAATFAAMKRNADVLAPDTKHGIWQDTAQFFDQGRSGRWQERLSPDDLDRYDRRVAALVAPDLARWAHHGWLGA